MSLYHCTIFCSKSEVKFMHILSTQNIEKKNCIISHAQKPDCASAQMQRLQVTDEGGPTALQPKCNGYRSQTREVAFAERKPLPRSTANSTVTACKCKLYDGPNSTKTQKYVCRVWQKVVLVFYHLQFTRPFLPAGCFRSV